MRDRARDLVKCPAQLPNGALRNAGLNRRNKRPPVHLRAGLPVLPAVRQHPNDAMEGHCEYPVHLVSDGALAWFNNVNDHLRTIAQASIRSSVHPGLLVACLSQRPYLPPCLLSIGIASLPPSEPCASSGTLPWTMRVPGD
ncbi:hypothetical protein C8J57DRAFT_1708780 [Mycena rebaudengoi]|nr:hypothetical protein C8J57DRAFT_1708780 [Mycena rebaudengoi]